MANILIIDDSPTDIHVYSKMLEGRGHSVTSADNAADGIERAKADRPDLILMDIIMPGMNGFQATRALSRDDQTCDIPVVILTTKEMETDRVWGLRQGAKNYLTKPTNERTLCKTIDQCLAAAN